MEASTLQAPAGLARARTAIGTPLLRLRSDEQLLELFRDGHDEAFSAIHERYHKRLLAYSRQMLPRRQDAEDALQDVFVRAYSGLRATEDAVALRPWLFRVAHNRCVDELRRPAPPPPEVMVLLRPIEQDPIAHAEQRESLRRLISDVRRLPDQQRSALLMRELGGMSYAELASAMGVTIPALKSLLVRARVGLVQSAEARDTDCGVIRTEIASAHDRGTRPNATARRHIRDCSGCRSFRREVRGVSRSLAAVIPTAGPLAALAHMLGFSGGAGGGATAGGATAGGATAGGAGALAGGGAAAGGGMVAAGATGHVATLIAAAVATAGGAVEIQHTIASPSRPAQTQTAPASSASRLAPVTASPAEQVRPAAPAHTVTVTRPAVAQSTAVASSRHPGALKGHHKHGAQAKSPAKASHSLSALTTGGGPADPTSATTKSSDLTQGVSTPTVTPPSSGSSSGSTGQSSTSSSSGTAGSPSSGSGSSASSNSSGSGSGASGSASHSSSSGSSSGSSGSSSNSSAPTSSSGSGTSSSSSASGAGGSQPASSSAPASGAPPTK